MMLKLRAIHKQLLRKLDTGEYAYHYSNFYKFDGLKTMYPDHIVNELIEAGYVVRDDWAGDDRTEERVTTTGKEWRKNTSASVNPHFTEWMRIRAELHGYTLGKFLEDEDLPDVCPQCGEACELNGDLVCYECKHDPSRGREIEEETEDVCECCGGSGRIYVPRFNSRDGFYEVPIRCECSFPTLIPYNVRMLVIEELSGLNEV